MDVLLPQLDDIFASFGMEADSETDSGYDSLSIMDFLDSLTDSDKPDSSGNVSPATSLNSSLDISNSDFPQGSPDVSSTQNSMTNNILNLPNLSSPNTDLPNGGNILLYFSDMN